MKERKHNPNNCPYCIVIQMAPQESLAVGQRIEARGMFKHIVHVKAIYGMTPGAGYNTFYVHGDKRHVSEVA